MPRHTLYAYADGNDLHDVAADIESRLAHFLRTTPWRHAQPHLVNQQHEDDPALRPGDLPDWDLGLNLDLPDPPHEPPAWFDDVARIATFLAADLRPATGRDFVIGIADNDHGFSEDLFTIDTDTPDLAALRRTIGTGDGAS